MKKNIKSGNPFEEKYSKLYDLFYLGKDYDKDCDFLEKVFKKFHVGEVRTIADLGCGTGNHLLRFAKKGYEMTGIDASRGMLKVAKDKALSEGLNVDLREMKFQNLELSEKKFDIVECMFNSIDYILEVKELIDFLKKVRYSLKDDGLFVFDFRNAKPALKDYDPKRVIHLRGDEKDIFRISLSRADPEKKIFHTKFECFVVDNHFVDKFTEDHILRVFDQKEIREYLTIAGFDVVSMFPFLEMDKKINEESDWTICVVAKKTSK